MTLPVSVDDLTALVIEQQKKLDHQSLFIEQLLEQIKLAQHNRFGAKSEAISPDQLRLILDELEAADPVADKDSDNHVEPAPKTPVPKAKRGRRALPAHLPRIEIKHTLDDANRQCEHCKERMVPLSEKITEQLDIIPAMRGDLEELAMIPGAMPRLDAIPPGCAFNPRCTQTGPRCKTEVPRINAEGAACWLTWEGGVTG